MNSIDVYIGRRLNEARLACGLAPNDAAARLEISVDALAQIESGEMRASASLIFQATRAYDYPLAQMFETTVAVNDP